MNDMSLDQIKAAILRGLKDMEDRFARDPRPTDGSVRAEQEAMRNYRAESGKEPRRALKP